MRLSFRRFPAFVGLQLFALLSAMSLHAGTITVTTTADGGAGSLRDAIAAANNGDTIQFDPGLNGQTISLTSAELAIDKSIKISGPGPSQLAVTRSSGTFRIFHVLPGHVVTIEGLTISDGKGINGGGLLNDHATLTLNNCAVQNNSARFGGGVYNDASGSSATLNIFNTIVSGNLSSSIGNSALGGGICNIDPGANLTITNSTVSGNVSNSADSVACSGFGGGIHNGARPGSLFQDGGTVTITNSIVSNNSTGLPFGPPSPFPCGYGGGISNSGTMSITNSTISGNTAGLHGGGICHSHGTLTINSSTINANSADGISQGKPEGVGGGIESQNTMTITNSTISGNSANYSAGGIAHGIFTKITNSTISGNTASLGGGIASSVAEACSPCQLEIANTILQAGAEGTNIFMFNNTGTATSLGHNLSSDDGSGVLTAPGDQINTDPMLGPLQNNGGPTFTHDLLTGSPAIDTGDPNFSPPPFFDQRGPPYNRVINGRIDIGSFEVQPPPSEPCIETFDNVAAPALPDGWVATNPIPGNGVLWLTSTAMPDTAPNAAFIDDQAGTSDKVLDSKAIFIGSAAEQVFFRQNFDTQSGRDGGVLEVSAPNINGGTFTDVTDPAVGGSFDFGGYTGLIDVNAQNPLAGRMAWSGNSAGYITTVVNLGPNVSGQIIKLRFRMGTDEAGAAPGWFVDSIVADELCEPPPSPTPTATATATATPTATAPPPGTPTPTPTPTASPSPSTAQTLNISTRLRVETGDNVLIAGFIITGNTPKTAAVRGIGPSLTAFGINDALADPTLELRAANGTSILQNDNWQDNAAQEIHLIALGLALQHPNESGMVATLNSDASYTAILAGNNGGTGVGLVEVYDTDQTAESQLANISTRGLVQTGDNVMIGGFILGGSSNTGIVVRGLGPSLVQFGVSNALANPTLELRDSNGVLLIGNDNWQDDSAQAAQLSARGLAPQDPNESGIFASLPAGAFTAILAGENGGTGIGLVEIYNVP